MDFQRLTAKFPPHSIEWRVQNAGETNGKIWARVLAYVDARAVQDRLDEVCGPENWQDSYQVLDKGILCTLSIRVKGEWIHKTNGAPETDIEGFKGGISKALVRAASTWAIGRYLYSLEATFAQIVDKGTPGAKSGQTKDKKWFYWLEPDLPKWALPDLRDQNIQTISEIVNSEKNLQQSLEEDKKEMIKPKSRAVEELDKILSDNSTSQDVPNEAPRSCKCGSKVLLSKTGKFYYCKSFRQGKPADHMTPIPVSGK